MIDIERQTLKTKLLCRNLCCITNGALLQQHFHVVKPSLYYITGVTGTAE